MKGAACRITEGLQPALLSTNIFSAGYLHVELKKLEHSLVAFCSLQLACLIELIINHVHVGNHPNTKSAKAIRMLLVTINHISGADIPPELPVNAISLLHSIAMADALKGSDDILGGRRIGSRVASVGRDV